MDNYIEYETDVMKINYSQDNNIRVLWQIRQKQGMHIQEKTWYHDLSGWWRHDNQTFACTRFL